jgi:hypothetical protein
MMRRLRWISLFAIVLALVVGGNAAAQAAPAAQQGTGQICVLAFDDQDGNGKREPDEPLLAGMSFTLADDAGVVKRSYKTDGVSEPYCFGSLAAGAYTVQARGAGSREVTTPGQWAISLSNLAEFKAEYGVRQVGSGAVKPPAGDAQPAATSGGSMSTLGRIVLGVLGLVVLAGAGLLALTTLQRARGHR